MTALNQERTFMISALRQSLLLTLGTILAGTLACDSGTTGEQNRDVVRPNLASASLQETSKEQPVTTRTPDLLTVRDGASEPGDEGSPTVDEGSGLGVEAASDRDIDGQMGAIRATLEAYSACATTCTSKDYETPTNLESCMLRCRNRAESAGITPDSKAHRLMTELDACSDRCEQKDVDHETNRETCHLNCDNAFTAQGVLLKAGDNLAK